MNRLLQASRVIDAVNDKFGYVANWLVLIACLISAGNAISRHFFSASSNAWLEVQWYMFAAMVLLGGPYTLKVNEHVRVDVLYSSVSERTRLWIDILGGFLFLLPICVILVYFTWPFPGFLANPRTFLAIPVVSCAGRSSCCCRWDSR